MDTQTPITFQLGDAQVSIINIGHLKANLAEWFALTKDGWPAQYDAYFAEPLAVPIQCIHIKLPGVSVLVDAAEYDFPADSVFAIPNYQPPAGLLAQLAQVGVAPADINHVIITHIHFDHYNGVTRRQNGEFVPTFPNARYHLSRADWHRDVVQKGLKEPNSTDSRTVGVLDRHQMLALVDGETDLGHGVHIMPAPGETEGHQIVAVETGGATLYCLGDLYHHEVEVEQPEWAVHWSDVATTFASRQRFIKAALPKQATLIAGHIAGAGRLRSTASGVAWESITSIP